MFSFPDRYVAGELPTKKNINIATKIVLFKFCYLTSRKDNKMHPKFLFIQYSKNKNDLWKFSKLPVPQNGLEASPKLKNTLCY